MEVSQPKEVDLTTPQNPQSQSADKKMKNFVSKLFAEKKYTNENFADFINVVFKILEVFRKVQMSLSCYKILFHSIKFAKESCKDVFSMTPEQKNFFLESANIMKLDFFYLQDYLEVFDLKICSEKLRELAQALLSLKRYVDMVYLFKMYEPPADFQMKDLIVRMCAKQMYDKCELLVEDKQEYIQMFIDHLSSNENWKIAKRFINKKGMSIEEYPKIKKFAENSFFKFYFNEFMWEQCEERFAHKKSLLGKTADALFSNGKTNEALSLVKRHQLSGTDFISTKLQEIFEIEKDNFAFVSNILFEIDEFGPFEVVYQNAKEADYIHLKTYGFDEKDIEIIDEADESMSKAFEILLSSKIVGLDSEFLSEEDGVAIFQISTAKNNFIFDLISLKNNNQFRDYFVALLNDEAIIKVGHSIAGDLSQIEATFEFKEQIELKNYYELTKLYQTYQAKVFKQDSKDPKFILKTSLKHISNEIIQKELSKGEQFSNWTKRPLRKSQIHYAALDAFVCVLLFQKLKEFFEKEKIEITTMRQNISSKFKIVSQKNPDSPEKIGKEMQEESEEEKKKEEDEEISPEKKETPILNKEEKKKKKEESKTKPTLFSCDDKFKHFYLDKKAPELKFIMDNMLGKLAFFFRNLGIDAYYMTEKDDQQIYHLSLTDQRIIVTKNKILYQTKHGLPILMPKSTNPEEQFKEIKDFFKLDFSECKKLSRCVKCNAAGLEVIDKMEAKKQFSWIDEEGAMPIKEYMQCTQCKQIYWEGSTFRKAQKRFEDLSNAQK